MRKETDSPFDVFAESVPAEESELSALTNALQRSRGFKLIFARCDQANQRRRLIEEVKARLPERTIQEITLREEIPHLLDELRQRISNPPPDAVFVSGLEYSLPVAAEAYRTPLVANLNISRDSFPRVVPCPLVFWIPEYILNAIFRGAPDFFSVRSGLYSFVSPTPEAGAAVMETSLTSESLTAIAGLPLEEKLERVADVQSLLTEYESFPPESRDWSAEARLHNTLGDLYHTLGNYAEAEPHYQQALAIRQKTLPEDHPNIAISLNNLAALYNDQARYQEAEPLYKQALEIRQKALPEDHPNIAISLNNLAELYRNQGRSQEAEPLYKQALEIKQQVLPKSHLSISTSLNNLALLYNSQARYQEAEPLYKQALEIRQKALPESHPDIAQSLNNLAAMYYNSGRYQEAEPLYQQALAILQKALGPEHPHTKLVAENYRQFQEERAQRERG